MKFVKKSIISVVLFIFSFHPPVFTEETPAAPATPVSDAAPAEHFFNPPENLNPDPDYAPGDWPLPETFAAKTVFNQKVTELTQAYPPIEEENLYTINVGQISASVIKNETATVLGTFNHFFGILKMTTLGPQRMRMLIDINSYDSGVPGRNNRILAIFFESMQPDYGTADILFDQFEFGGQSWDTFTDGVPHVLNATGTLLLNQTTRDISAKLIVQRQGSVWHVKTESPIELLISNFAFGDKINALMKECNHKSIGNKVNVTVDFYLK